MHIEQDKKRSELEIFVDAVEDEAVKLCMLLYPKEHISTLDRAKANGRDAHHTARLIGKLDGQTPPGGELSDQLQILEMSAGYKKMMASQLYKDHQLLEADFEAEHRLLDAEKAQHNEHRETKQPLGSDKGIDQQKLSEYLKNLDQDRERDPDKDREY